MPVPTVAKIPAPTMLPKPSAMSAHGPSARRSFGLVSSAVSLASASKLRVMNKPADAGVFGGRSGAMAIERLLVGRRFAVHYTHRAQRPCALRGVCVLGRKQRFAGERPLDADRRVLPAQDALVCRIEMRAHLVVHDVH